MLVARYTAQNKFIYFYTECSYALKIGKKENPRLNLSLFVARWL